MSNRKTLARLLRPGFLIFAAALLLVASFPALQRNAAQAAAEQYAVAFERDGRIFTMNADGSNQQPVTPTYETAIQAAWSLDGKRLAYACGLESHDICVIDADGSNYERLTGTRGNSNPAWSPDGAQIAFTHYNGGDSQLYVMNADGSNAQPLAINYPGLLSADYAAYAPDGTRLAFVGQTEEASEIYTMLLDGSGTVAQVTSSGYLKQNLAFSPDSAQIAFDTTNDLYVVSAFGGADTPVATDWDYNQHASWSPDGAQMVFFRQRRIIDEEGSEQGIESGLYAISATGVITSLNVPGGRDPIYRLVLIEPTPEPSPSPSPSPSPEPEPSPSPSPAQRINDLDLLVRTFGLNNGITNSLTVKLRHALDELNGGNTASACDHLAAFISQARAQSGKHLTTAQANQIINEATAIRAALGCG